MKKTTQLQGITDLTVLARVRTGFVPGAFNTVTYAHRLNTVLRVLNGVRQASREAALQRSPFADSIGRFRAIHFFRFAVVPSLEESAGPHQLLLNVTFDGGWEPYMRIIWGPLGKLLDLIFCNCERYPMAFQCSFDEYMRWVRENEVSSTFFYADSAATVADSHYLRELEDLQCSEGAREGFDVRAASLAMTEPPSRTIANLYAVTSSVRVLKALATLRDFFPAIDDTQAQRSYEQHLVLLRFTRDLLSDLREWIEEGMFQPGGAFDTISGTFKHERAWLMSADKKASELKERLTFVSAGVQVGIVKSYPEDVRHGVLVMLRIKDLDKAKAWLAKAPVTREDGKAPPDGIYRNLALTHAGLKRLVKEDDLKRFPQEYIAGMEARAGLLGDVRGNHPDYWSRPRRNWPWPAPSQSEAGPPIELSTVHVLVQLRTALNAGEEGAAADGATPLPRLASAVNELHDSKGTGLQVLFVQPMRLATPRDGEKSGRDHFGYVDGISQPTLSPTVPSPSFWTDQVKTGDLFLGYSNSRGDKRVPEPDPSLDPEPDPLLDNGTFLVVRKLRQNPQLFDALVAGAAQRSMPDAGPGAQALLREEIRAKIMGRYSDGTPMVKPGGTSDNDFTFRGDGAGGQCPHRSHIRRVNPRGALPAQPAPRIVRRGMSYGPPRTDKPDNEPRGIVFMAYNASIAEQFEVIQRWVTSGNSSGLSSTQDDPLLGVPEIGQQRTFRYVCEGKVMRVDLGEKPLVELQWGLYAFVPSIKALETLGKPAGAGSGSASGAEASRSRPEAERNRESPSQEARRSGLEDEPDGESPSMKKWRLLLEDEHARANTWKKVREEPSGVQNGEDYGLLVGSSEKILKVLKDDGSEFSVHGYGTCMKDSGIGRGFLGMDDVGPHKGHAKQAPAVNEIIEKFAGEKEAFDAAFRHASEHLARLLAGRREVPVDVIEFGRRVLSLLCKEWFGLPDEVLMKHGTKADDLVPDDIPHCPGNFLTVSRYIFSPHPLPPVETPAKLHGERILKAVKKLLREAETGKRELTELVEKIVNAPGIKGEDDLPAITVAGVMLGFPPTVLGNLVTVLMRWIETLELWEFQQDMPADIDYDGAKNLLGDTFLKTMRRMPVPYAIWRTAMTDHPLGNPDKMKGCKVVVGLGSAMDGEGDSMLMFGGARSGPLKTIHACPGYGLAMGVMLGSVAALLAAGALSRTADPRVLILTGLAK